MRATAVNQPWYSRGAWPLVVEETDDSAGRLEDGRGLGLGAMVGALCIGSALPHVIVGVPWQVRSDPNNKHATTPSIDLLCDEPAPPSNLH